MKDHLPPTENLVQLLSPLSIAVPNTLSTSEANFPVNVITALGTTGLFQALQTIAVSLRKCSLLFPQNMPRRRVSVAVVPKFNALNLPGQSPSSSPVPSLPVLVRMKTPDFRPFLHCPSHHARGSRADTVRGNKDTKLPAQNLNGGH